MKTELETIPVWDALRENGECLICSLMKKAEEDALGYYLSSAIMTPEVRVKTNKYGFCPHHWVLLTERGNAQSLALILDTYYGENENAFRKGFSDMAKAGNPRQCGKAAGVLRKAAEEREKGCLVCAMMADRLYRYSFTLSSLFASDEEFRSSFTGSKGLCLHHTLIVSSTAHDALSGESFTLFQKELFALLERNLRRVRKDDWWMTQKYKSENAQKPWNGCEDAHRRAALKLTGEGRVIDPVSS